MEDEDKNSKSFGKPCGFESHHRHSIIKQLRIERFWAVFLFLLSFLYFGVFWEDIDDCIRRGHLTGEIQMCINVACCADVTVTEPLLNLLQAHAIGIEQTGTTMAQIVKADTLHLVCYQKIREMLAQEIGPNPLSHRVYIKTQLGARTFNKTANRRGLSVAAQAAVWNNSLVSSIIFSKF